MDIWFFSILVNVVLLKNWYIQHFYWYQKYLSTFYASSNRYTEPYSQRTGLLSREDRKYTGLVRCYLELSCPTATLLSCHTQCLFVFYTIFLMTFAQDFLWYFTCIYFQIYFAYCDVFVHMCHSAIEVVRENLLGTGPLSPFLYLEDWTQVIRFVQQALTFKTGKNMRYSSASGPAWF